MDLQFKLLLAFFICALLAFTHETHKNMPEDAFIFMEIKGSLQQRWAADYFKAKAKGRFSGSCEIVNYTADYTGDKSDGTQCGAAGIARIGGLAPDFFIDNFWDDLIFFDWQVPNYGLMQNNFSSMQHFLNLIKTNEDGDPLLTNVYNDYDGYSYNASYGFPNLGLDQIMAIGMNNAQMTVDLMNCTHETCTDRYSRHPNGNPVIDYKQNGSTTPVGSGSGSKKLGSSNGQNYNCFSDTAFNYCPDIGDEINGYFQIPNTHPGEGDGPLDFFIGDQDWVIFEPADNPSTFYYNEMFLEGAQSRNATFQKNSVVGRYYGLLDTDIIFLAVVNHWTGDMNQISHVWNTLGYNHGEYEGFTDEKYGIRVIGGSDPDKNYEDYNKAAAYMTLRQNRYRGEPGRIDKILMENAFLTHYVRLRSTHDILSTTNTSTWTTAAKWAVNNAIVVMANVFEKGALDLRKCRNSSNCDNK